MTWSEFVRPHQTRPQEPHNSPENHLPRDGIWSIMEYVSSNKKLRSGLLALLLGARTLLGAPGIATSIKLEFPPKIGVDFSPAFSQGLQSKTHLACTLLSACCACPRKLTFPHSVVGQAELRFDRCASQSAKMQQRDTNQQSQEFLT